MTGTERPPSRGGIRIRIYEVRADGTTRDLPLAQPALRSGPCGVPGCTCLEGERR